MNKMEKRCLFCYLPLKESVGDFHARCSKTIFGLPSPPELSYSDEEILSLGEQIIRSQFALTGVQPKLSLEIKKSAKDSPARFTLVGLFGNYILKPPSSSYSMLPEIEDLTMHLAEVSKIPTVPHSLIRMKSGKLAYITKRIDRVANEKVHMEDFCQITERLTEHKYQGSYEQIGKAILKYSKNPGLDSIYFIEQVLFSFLTGNADMHLKNFSMLESTKKYVLAPAYDHLATALVVKGDKEDLALTLNGKKNKIARNDFTIAMIRLELSPKTIENTFRKFYELKPSWLAMISISFLSEEMKKKYKSLVEERWTRIF
jgi:serine/threonine-protein kinase HipA